MFFLHFLWNLGNHLRTGQKHRDMLPFNRRNLVLPDFWKSLINTAAMKVNQAADTTDPTRILNLRGTFVPDCIYNKLCLFVLRFSAFYCAFTVSTVKEGVLKIRKMLRFSERHLEQWLRVAPRAPNHHSLALGWVGGPGGVL